nr:Scr1 family TA system antitoxin-like transcriptional regulator [Frankia sp. CiP3]
MRVAGCATQPNITIQVLPFTFGAYAAFGYPFTIMTFAGSMGEEETVADQVRVFRCGRDDCGRVPGVRDVGGLVGGASAHVLGRVRCGHRPRVGLPGGVPGLQTWF